MESQLAHVSVETISEKKNLLKENKKLNHGVKVTEPIKFGSHGTKESIKEEGKRVPVISLRKDAVEDWPEPEQIHSFFIVRYRRFEDPNLKRKVDQAEKELQKMNLARFQIIEKLRAKRIKSLQYRIQHESIPLTEEKQILREIKRLEGTRGEVKEHVALKAQIQDSMGEKEEIQKQVKAMNGNIDGVHKEQQVVKAKRKQLDDQLNANASQIKSLDEQLKELTKKRDKAFVHVQELRNQREEANAPFYKNFALLQKAKFLANKKDIEALKELSLTEVDKFISLWSGKPFRDDYERRILTSLDIRQLSRDGRMRNPDEKPLVLPQAQTVSQTEIIEKTTAKPSKKESVPAQKVNKEKNTEKPKGASSKVTETTKENYIFDIEEEIRGLEKQPKDVQLKSKESDEAKLREMKRVEEIAKNRQAMERKKKLAEKAAAKAAIKAQKEAEKRKLKEIILIILPFVFKELEKKAKKKAGASVPGQESTEEPIETAAGVAEEEKIEEEIEKLVTSKLKEPKGKAGKHRPICAKSTEIPKAILKRKKAMNYWLWAAPAALVVPLLLVAYTHLL
ncbi:unnamed protein product [Withania somnifera]